MKNASPKKLSIIVCTVLALSAQACVHKPSVKEWQPGQRGVQLASEDPIRLEKGQRAPRNGWLLTNEMVAEIIAEIEACENRVTIAVNRTRAEERANCARSITDADADLTACEKKREIQIAERDKELREMREELAKGESFWSHPVVVVSGIAIGFAGGTLAAIALAK